MVLSIVTEELVTEAIGNSCGFGGFITERPDGYKELDIMVKPEQKIEDVYDLLVENGLLPAIRHESQLRVYSVRHMSYVNPILTFWQGGIQAGDILILS